jgi:hypothetical protein
LEDGEAGKRVRLIDEGSPILGVQVGRIVFSETIVADGLGSARKVFLPAGGFVGQSSRVLLALLVLLAPASIGAQAPAPPASAAPDSDAAMAAAAAIRARLKAAEGISLPARTVNSSIGVSATLLTYDAVSRLFGKEIANTYAVVQLTISNRNSEAAFVLHSAYLDISKWALGGAGLTVASPAMEWYQASTNTNRISSVEARIARGQLLDAQTWSKRNWTVRTLTAVGSVAAGVVFNAGENAAKYVAAFNGTVVPGVAFAWPDGSVAQINRISDFGFQTNKVFPKGSGDIIVCFFPMDLFLSPGLRQVFVHSPSLFLSPYQILFSRENGKARVAMGLPFDKDDPAVRTARSALSCFPGPGIISLKDAVDHCLRPPFDLDEAERQPTEAQWKRALGLIDYIGRFGANNIPVIVDGVMTLELDAVPAAIDTVTFEGDASTQAFWASGEHQARLECRYCANGQVMIQEAATLGIADVKVVSDQKDAHSLTASFKLVKPIDTGSVLHFVIAKPSLDPTKTEPIKSTPFAYTVSYLAVRPTVSGIKIDNKKITLTGTSLDNTATHPMALSVSREGGLAADKVIAWPSDANSATVSFAAPEDLAPGCWHVRLKWKDDAITVPDAEKAQKIMVSPAPALSGAKRGADSIVVTGSQLADTTACSDKPLAFELVDSSAKEKPPLAVKATFDSLTKATLSLPAAAKTGKWLVRVVGADITIAVE